MKLSKFSTLFLCLLLFWTGKAKAETYQMIFWYPGEAGSTAEAETTLNTFFEYINKHIAPDKIAGKYFNSVPEGMKFSKKAAFGILSFAAYEINKKQLGDVKIILQTLPLPDGETTENYVIMGRGPAPTLLSVPLYSKQPLTKEFAANHILPTASNTITVTGILPTLKEIASGVKIGAAILTPMEYHTLKNMSQPWVKELKVWHTSAPLPSAPVLAFGSPPVQAVQKFKDTLLKMAEDAEGQAILETLRLKGFR